jgi:hypothetical protein
MRFPLEAAIGAVLVLLASGPAQATIITYEMFGTIGELPEVSQVRSWGVDTGDPIYLELRIDTETPDICDQPGQGAYLLSYALVELGGQIATSSTGDFGVVEVNNAASSCSGSGSDQSGVYVRIFVGPTLTLPGNFVGDGLLPIPLFATVPVNGTFGLTWDDGDVSFYDVRERIVPEPTTLILFGTGLVAISMEWKRRRRAT